ncbi:MAG: S41 family peptidase [Gemmataceae bacterium]|nr:S41 family peptidase [Gemmataceae bacterium]
MTFLRLLPVLILALPSPGRADPLKLDAAARDRVVDRVAALLIAEYVDPAVGKAAAAAVRDKHAKKEYDALADGKALADRLTADLQAVTKDKHLRAGYSPDPRPAPKADDGPSPAERAAMRRGMARVNHGLGRVEVLPGNVGYVEVRVFADPADTAAKWAGVFALLADADALVLDLRECGGAVSPDATPLVCSYLFDEPLHLYSIYWRPADSTRQFWTQRSVPGAKFLGKDVYVLTSRKTFSGAEQIA